jgi:hypothetical protein
MNLATARKIIAIWFVNGVNHVNPSDGVSMHFMSDAVRPGPFCIDSISGSNQGTCRLRWLWIKNTFGHPLAEDLQKQLSSSEFTANAC